jgi:hypothetical protein
MAASGTASGAAAVLDSGLQIARLEACRLGNASQHAWPDLFLIVKGEDDIRPAFALKHSM